MVIASYWQVSRTVEFAVLCSYLSAFFSTCFIWPSSLATNVGEREEGGGGGGGGSLVMNWNMSSGQSITIKVSTSCSVDIR